MLSLSPRFDLFHFEIPKDYFPQELIDKYNEYLNKDNAVIYNIIDYVNESIQGVNIPGISDLTINQNQVSHNNINRVKRNIDIEPNRENSYLSPENILSKIENKFTITFRQNQGLMNYFMMYETLFHRYLKEEEYNSNHDVFLIDIINEKGSIVSRISLYQPIINSISGLEFSYSKAERQVETFEVEFTFNNIDFEFVRQ